MFGADKEAHTDALIKAVVAKVGPKIDRRQHQGVPALKKEKLWYRQALGHRGKEGKHPWQELHHQAASPSGYQVLTDKNTLLH